MLSLKERRILYEYTKTAALVMLRQLMRETQRDEKVRHDLRVFRIRIAFAVLCWNMRIACSVVTSEYSNDVTLSVLLLFEERFRGWFI